MINHFPTQRLKSWFNQTIQSMTATGIHLGTDEGQKDCPSLPCHRATATAPQPPRHSHRATATAAFPLNFCGADNNTYSSTIYQSPIHNKTGTDFFMNDKRGNIKGFVFLGVDTVPDYTAPPRCPPPAKAPSGNTKPSTAKATTAWDNGAMSSASPWRDNNPNPQIQLTQLNQWVHQLPT
jgi:hypothetical protein